MDPKALFKITYGMFLLTARQEQQDNGCIINTCMQVANEPDRIAISVLKANRSCAMVQETGKFALSSISTQADFALFQRFGMQSGRDVDKFAGFDGAVRCENGLLRLNKAANMYLTATVTDRMDLGTHMLFVARVDEAQIISQEISCSYTYYQTMIKPQPQKTEEKKWVCDVCGYVYEGAQLPDDFICPWCNHGKEDFSPL